jgi:hypothetical protein
LLICTLYDITIAMTETAVTPSSQPIDNFAEIYPDIELPDTEAIKTDIMDHYNYHLDILRNGGYLDMRLTNSPESIENLVRKINNSIDEVLETDAADIQAMFQIQIKYVAVLNDLDSELVYETKIDNI